MIGAEPAEAAEGTVRKAYAESKGRNAVHGSDSDENAEVREIPFLSRRDALIHKVFKKGFCGPFFWQ